MRFNTACLQPSRVIIAIYERLISINAMLSEEDFRETSLRDVLFPFELRVTGIRSILQHPTSLNRLLRVPLNRDSCRVEHNLSPIIPIRGERRDASSIRIAALKEVQQISLQRNGQGSHGIRRRAVTWTAVEQVRCISTMKRWKCSPFVAVRLVVVGLGDEAVVACDEEVSFQATDVGRSRITHK